MGSNPGNILGQKWGLISLNIAKNIHLKLNLITAAYSVILCRNSNRYVRFILGLDTKSTKLLFSLHLSMTGSVFLKLSPLILKIKSCFRVSSEVKSDFFLSRSRHIYCFTILNFLKKAS